MKFDIGHLFLWIIIAAGAETAHASNVSCTVKRVAGMFRSYTQPQIGDTLVFDADAETLPLLQVGTATITGGAAEIRQNSLEGVIRFSSSEETESAKYNLQLTLFGDDLASGSLQSVTQAHGFIGVGVAELDCHTLH